MSDDSTWQPASPPARPPASDTSAPGARHQAPGTRHQAAVTHQVLIGTSDPGLAHQPDDDGHQDSRLVEALGGLRFVFESPGSLRDQIEFAQEGAYTIRQDGAWRNANIWFARLIAVPGLTLCYLLGWGLFTRLSRALIAWPVMLLVLWLLNSWPVTAWLIPDWADFTTWLPGPDPSAVPGQVG